LTKITGFNLSFKQLRPLSLEGFQLVRPHPIGPLFHFLGRLAVTSSPVGMISQSLATGKILVFVDKATWEEVTPDASNSNSLEQDTDTRTTVDLKGFKDQGKWCDNGTTKDIPAKASVASKEIFRFWSWHVGETI
jgi:hypothetical protein